MRLPLLLSAFAILGMALGGLAPAASQAPLPAGSPVDFTKVIVMFHPEAGIPLDLDALAAAHGARVADRWEPLHGAVLRVDSVAAGQALVAALLARPDVAAAEPDITWRIHTTNPDDPRFFTQWAHKTLRTPQAWDHGFGNHGVRIAVLDTGAQLDHPDLQANVCGQKNFLGSGPAEDDNNHGSHTAGIVGATINNGVGIAGTSNSCLYIGKVCDEGGSCSTSLIGSAVTWALNPDGDANTDDKVHVISMSFGGALGSNTMRLAMSIAWQNNILLVASAGNEFCTPVGFPAAYDTVIAVGALEVPPVVGTVLGGVTGQTEIRAPYSNCGIEVELAAPGSAILSTIRGSDYASFSGTSMAAPYVAGVAGLVKAANPSLTNAELRCLMDTTAQDYGAPKRDPEFGFGKVRPDLAVNAAILGQACILYQFGLGLNLPPPIGPL